MFGRELKAKLPELRCAGNLLDEGVRNRDWCDVIYEVMANTADIYINVIYMV